MEYHPLFDTDENKALMAVCARKLIRNIGVGGVVWGVLNILLGMVFLLQSPINAGLLALGVIMFATGVQALRKPTLGALLAETLVTMLLFVWNLGMALYNYHLVGVFQPRGLILPIIVASVFYKQYTRLGLIRDQITNVKQDDVTTLKQMSKNLLKKKLKQEPEIIQAIGNQCRAQFLGDRAFFVQKDLMRAFVATREDVQTAIRKPDKTMLTLVFKHPLGDIKYVLDKKNSLKLKNWLAAQPIVEEYALTQASA